ncbi:patatin-like phospholipase family protein [Rhodococcus sp. NPDC058521]|uniref:patatin-like phospholipase family protein n=1 Tax=Rhodococcus sp. NPDC058521 TaxID=3346536 RepID=UPI00365D9E14
MKARAYDDTQDPLEDDLDLGSTDLDAELAHELGTPEQADVELPNQDAVLSLQRMEAALVRADLEHPDVLTREEYRRLRYIIGFARLTVFEPGAAGPDGSRGRPDVDVGLEIAAFRRRVVDALHDPLRNERKLQKRLVAAKRILPSLVEPLEDERRAVADRHTSDFSLVELDSEVCYKALVCSLGGGGGAGYVYLGGMKRIIDQGLTPAYILTTSIGAIVGSVTARTLPIPVDEYIDWAKTVSYGGILGPARLGNRQHGLGGVFSLTFDDFADDLFRCEDGSPMTLADLSIPFETVVAGVRRQSFDRLPARLRSQENATTRMRSLPTTGAGLGRQVGLGIWQASAFIDRQLVKPIILGSDDLTSKLNVVDAASFSASIPGVLHHETRDPNMTPILDELFEQKDVAALFDGFAAGNVPVEMAWRRVQDGRLGTRNACYYAWDCFHPQWGPKHLFLQPLTQAVRIQMVRNAPFADQIVRFRPTLSALNIAPSPRALDRAVHWGGNSVEESLPMIEHLVEPFWWEGSGPPRVEKFDIPVEERDPTPPARSMRLVLRRARDRVRIATMRGHRRRIRAQKVRQRA